MAEPHLDHPGDISWWAGHGPAETLGFCPHDCNHWDVRTIAWGPDFAHYELVVCVEKSGCAGACRGWVDQHLRVTTAFRLVADGKST